MEKAIGVLSHYSGWGDELQLELFKAQEIVTAVAKRITDSLERRKVNAG